MTTKPKTRARYVVRDALGEIRSMGRTKAEALAPYKGLSHKRANMGASVNPPLRKGRLWAFLFRRGWRCAREQCAVPAGPARRRVTTASRASNPSPTPRT